MTAPPLGRRAVRAGAARVATRGSSRQLVLGQLVGQVALVVAIPFLTRLLPAGEMGAYQAGFSIALVLQPLATLRRELLIPVSRAADTRRQRRVAVVFAGACTAVLAAAGLVLHLVSLRHAADVLLATALILFSTALMTVENAYLIRQGALSRLAARNLLAGSVAAVLQVLTALAVPTAAAVAGALLLGRGVATAVTVVRRSVDETHDEAGARRSQRAVSAILSAMVANASSQAVVIGSFVVLGPVASATVGVGQRIGGAPTTLVGQALSQVALGSAAPLIRERRPGLAPLLRRQTLRTAAVAAVTAAGLMVGAPLLAVPVLGAGWGEAGIVTAVFAIPLSLQLVALPVTTLLIPLGYERQLLGLQCGRLALILGTLALASAVTGDLVAACVATSIAWTLAYVPILWMSFAAARAHDRAAMSDAVEPVPSETR